MVDFSNFCQTMLKLLKQLKESKKKNQEKAKKYVAEINKDALNQYYCVDQVNPNNPNNTSFSGYWEIGFGRPPSSPFTLKAVKLNHVTPLKFFIDHKMFDLVALCITKGSRIDYRQHFITEDVDKSYNPPQLNSMPFEINLKYIVAKQVENLGMSKIRDGNNSEKINDLIFNVIKYHDINNKYSNQSCCYYDWIPSIINSILKTINGKKYSFDDVKHDDGNYNYKLYNQQFEESIKVDFNFGAWKNDTIINIKRLIINQYPIMNDLTQNQINDLIIANIINNENIDKINDWYHKYETQLMIIIYIFKVLFNDLYNQYTNAFQNLAICSTISNSVISCIVSYVLEDVSFLFKNNKINNNLFIAKILLCFNHSKFNQFIKENIYNKLTKEEINFIQNLTLNNKDYYNYIADTEKCRWTIEMKIKLFGNTYQTPHVWYAHLFTITTGINDNNVNEWNILLSKLLDKSIVENEKHLNLLCELWKDKYNNNSNNNNNVKIQMPFENDYLLFYFMKNNRIQEKNWIKILDIFNNQFYNNKVNKSAKYVINDIFTHFCKTFAGDKLLSQRMKQFLFYKENIFGNLINFTRKIQHCFNQLNYDSLKFLIENDLLHINEIAKKDTVYYILYECDLVDEKEIEMAQYLLDWTLNNFTLPNHEKSKAKIIKFCQKNDKLKHDDK